MVTKTRIDDAEVRKFLAELPESVFEAAKKSFKNATLGTQRTVLTAMGKDPINSLQIRTGDLARSIQVTTTGNSLKALKSEIFSKKVYAPIHEEGGTIKAKNAFKNLPGGPYLAIPSDLNKTPAGVTRLSVREAFSIPGQVQTIPLFFSKKAHYMLFDRDVGPLFWLVNEVTIKPRLGMEKAAIGEIPDLLSELDDLLLEGL